MAPKNRQGEQMEPTSGSIEAFEMKHGAPTVGIQWHPEAYFKQRPTPEDKRHTNILKSMAEAGDAYQAKRRMLGELKQNASVGTLLKASGVFRHPPTAVPASTEKKSIVADEKSMDKDSIHYLGF